MPIRHLNKLFYPRSVAVIGASNAEGAPGHVVMHNLLQGGFEGPIMPVAPADQAIAGVLAYPTVESLPITPDLGIVATEAGSVASAIDALGARGTRAGVVLSGAPGPASEEPGRAFRAAIIERAQAHSMRVLGPTCLGLMVPHIGLNATSAHVPAATGSVAFVSQSAAICTAVLDWAKHRDIGFSHFVSLGDAADIEFGEVLDFLGSDAMTRSVLLYVEALRGGRTFMSAGRGASRNKPILVIKAGRSADGQGLVEERTSGPTGGDDVYDASIRRAGMLRVFSFGELFAAVETLARAKPLHGDRLAVIANGYGMAIMAADTLRSKGGRLAALSAETRERLAGVLPPGGARANPISVTTGAPPATYADAARILFEAPEVDAVMVLHVPTAMASSTDAAAHIIEVARAARGNLLTSWMGGDTVEPARHLFADARIPTYDTPTQAIDAFMHLSRFRQNQELLMETPPSRPYEFTPATPAARVVIDHAMATGRTDLDPAGARALLSAYGIPYLETHVATSADAAADLACRLGFPVIVGVEGGTPARAIGDTATGVPLDSPASVRRCAEALLADLESDEPGADRLALSIRQVPVRPADRQTRIAVKTDPVFGPVIEFGAGGPTGRLLGDHAVALPPLNTPLAREVVSRTEIAKALGGNGGVAPADTDALCLALVKVSQMVVDLPELASLDIDPLLVDAAGVLAVDAHFSLAPTNATADRRLAIRPYPKDLEEEFILASGRRVLLRPIRPEDEPEHFEFLSRVSAHDMRMRFFGVIGRLSHAEMARFTQIDYDREMAIIASAPSDSGRGRETLGVVRIIADPNNETAEYAILVRSDLKGQRLGWKLMDKIIGYCRQRGTRQIIGQVLRENSRMLELVTALGFEAARMTDDEVVEVALTLDGTG